MKHLLFALLASLSAPVFAQTTVWVDPVQQTEYFHFGEWTPEHKTAVVFADVCNVRSAPDAKAEVAGKLNIGTAVQILEITSVQHTQSGIKSPWLKIKTSALTGYVWGGLLSNEAIRLSDGKILVWGLLEIHPEMVPGWESNIKASVRLADKGAVIDKRDFPVTYGNRPEEGYLHVYPKPKITGVDHVFMFGTPSEACGVTASHHYFLYTGGKLVTVGSGYSVGDGGIFHASLDYAFPYPLPEGTYADYRYNPDPEIVMKIENEGSFDESCDWVETSKVRTFKWNGSKLEKFCQE